MGKLNRGKTTKLSIRLSTEGKQKASMIAKNLGISTGGAILFELTKLLENPPSKTEIINLENEISLERNHFVMTINEKTAARIVSLSEEYDMKKNVLIGLMVSDHFEKMEVPGEGQDLTPQRFMVQVNENLKKKIMEYSEENFIPLNALVVHSILEGPYDGLPFFKDGEAVQFFTNVPDYIREHVKQQAEERNVREHFYTALCLYKQFETPEGRFSK